MIRTGDQYRGSLRDGREVWIDGQKVEDLPSHPSFRPIVDVTARIYDLAHEDSTRELMSYVNATVRATRDRNLIPAGAQTAAPEGAST